MRGIKFKSCFIGIFVLFFVCIVACDNSVTVPSEQSETIESQYGKIAYRGNLERAPENAVKYDVYYNIIDGNLYIYDGIQWTLLAIKGDKGDTGAQGEKGLDGIPIIWKGSYSSSEELANPQEYWAYYNTSKGSSFIYTNGTWTLLAQSGTSITWKGAYSTVPENPSLYDAYYNTVDGCSYIYDGYSWTLLASKGAQGISGEKGDKGDAGSDGTDGIDGQSIVWNGSLSDAPAEPADFWAYYDTTSGCSYIYMKGKWNLLASSGASVNWRGSFDAAPSSPSLYDAYYNNTDGCSYIYDGTKWTLLASKGAKGDTGETGAKGDAGAQGIAGVDGQSIIWKGSFSSAPANAEYLWAYYNTADGCSYIYGADSQWRLLARRGTSITWSGSFDAAPSSPSLYDAYYNTSDGCSYIYDGTEWVLLASKGAKGDSGSQGEQGIKGVDGKSIQWKGTSATHPENPEELWTYYNSTDGNAYIFSGGSWHLLIEKLAVAYTPVRGTVIYSDKTDASNISVTIENSTGIISSITTGSDGCFNFNVEAGTYTIRANAVGYGESSKEIEVTAGETCTVTLNSLSSTYGIISGKVCDKESDPVEGAGVILTGDKGNTYRLITLADGTFSESVITDSYSVFISKSGFESVVLEGKYTVSSSQTTSVEASLEKEKKYTLTYNSNSDDEVICSLPAGRTAYASESIAVEAPSDIVPGYRFVKWNTDADGTGDSYTPGESDSIHIEKDTVLYAVWEKIATYSVTYDGNELSEGTAPKTVTCNNGTSLVINGVGTMQKYGYSFTFWTTGKDGSGDKYYAGDSASFTSDTTLYAQWKKCDKQFEINGVVYQINKDGNSYKVYSNNIGDRESVIVLEEIDGLKVTSVGASAFYCCSSLRSIVLPDTVTEIGNYAFAGCRNLVDISIPGSVTDIGQYAFFDCKAVESFTIPKTIVSIGQSAFDGCACSIVFEDGLTSIPESALLDASLITSVTIPESVTKMYAYTFNGCDNLEKVVVPKSVTFFGTATVYVGSYHYYGVFNGYSGKVVFEEGTEEISSRALYSASEVTQVEIPDSVKEIEYEAFSGCSGLSSITLPDGLTKIWDRAFNECSGLSEITLPDTITLIRSEAFALCSSLTNIIIPVSVTEIGERAFERCTGLVSATVPGYVDYGYSMFESCSSLKSITIADGSTKIGGNHLRSISTLESVTIPVSVTEIEANAFSGCSNLKTYNYGGTMEQWGSITLGTSWNGDVSESSVICTDGKVSL